MNPSIFSNLPNHLIMNIIKMTDDAKKVHKDKFKEVLNELEDEVMDYWINYNHAAGKRGYEDREEWIDSA